MSIIRLLGGVTRAEHAELAQEVQRLKTLTGADETLALVREARNAALSAQQDANSAANSAATSSMFSDRSADHAKRALAVAEELMEVHVRHREALDHHSEVLANHAVEIGGLDVRVTALEGGGVTEPSPDPEPESAAWSLVGRPYAPTGAEKQAHDQLKAYLGHVLAGTDDSGSGGISGVRGYAEQGNLYQLARPVRDTTQALLHAFRATGDLTILDACAATLQTAGTSLRPGWRGVANASGQESPNDPPAPGGNGYIEPGQHPDGIWVWTGTGVPHAVHTGRDVHALEAPKVWSMVAAITLALSQNRGAVSPAGHDYGALADYWTGHMQRWEATWRSNRWRRQNRAAGAIWNRGDGHVTSSELVLYHHMHALTGDAKWLAAAQQVHERLWNPGIGGYTTVESPTGPAIVWWRGDPAVEARRFSCPITYARYFLADSIELHHLGVEPYADPETMRSFARAIAHFVILPNLWIVAANTTVTARDISGGHARGGIPASPAGAWGGLTATHWTSWASFALYERWDDTGRIRSLNDAALVARGWGASPRGYAVPVGRLAAFA